VSETKPKAFQDIDNQIIDLKLVIKENKAEIMQPVQAFMMLNDKLSA
jgi:hypothetical protein